MENINDLLGEGLITCGFCEKKYSIKTIIDNKNYYKHDNKKCRFPYKKLDGDKVNEIFKLFYFSYFKMYDNIRQSINKNKTGLFKNIEIDNTKIKECWKISIIYKKKCLT
jgi:hypothetical protein